MRTKTIMVVEDELIVAEDLTRWLDLARVCHRSAGRRRTRCGTAV